MLDQRKEDIAQREWKLRHLEPLEIELRELKCQRDFLLELEDDMIDNEDAFLEQKRVTDDEVQALLTRKNSEQERVIQRRADLDKE